MKAFLLSIFSILLLAGTATADSKNKPKADATSKANDNEIHWMTMEQAQEAMKKQPKKVWVDVYTSWCGWCKVMDKKTFTNPNVIQYMNEHFYAVRLDAESKDSISFNGKRYGSVPDGRNGINQLALDLLQNQLTYPSSIFMQENFKNPMPPMAGYLDVPTIEVILTYLGKDKYKVMSFEQYKQEYTPSWGGESAGAN